MLARLILLFTLVPAVDLVLLIWIGRRIGTAPTLALILVTGLLGGWLARREGMRAWRQVRGALAAGQVPGDALLRGLFVFVGGALLIAPGVITDLVGLVLLAPPVQRAAVRRLRRRLERRVMRSTGGIEARYWPRD